ncbi:MAG TPA: aromatic compound degradation protein PaaI, partial [Streptosporangiaceae bacterium]
MLDRIAAVTTAEGTLAHRMGIEILSASAAEVVATMPVAGNTQPFGLLHGGASCVLSETIGSLGAALHAG